MRNLRAWSRAPDVVASLHLDAALFGVPEAQLAKIKIVGLSQHLNEKSAKIAELERQLAELKADA